MSELRCYTRGNANSQGKPRVYYTAYPDDYNVYYSEICNELIKCQDCAVYSLPPDIESDQIEDYEFKLTQMQLFVVPVTTKLLTKPNRAIDIEIPFAISHHIPILPLIRERGIDEKLYNIKFGDLQYLDKFYNDPTAIPYTDKLEKYIKSIFLGNELAEKVRAAFRAFIFLSYRKKDRKYAQELMRLIHSDPICRDIAIWYDEFLVPGESFNDAIRIALEKSNLFTLTVTPNLVNENNYILSTEYPMALELNKDILPVEMKKTKHSMLNELFKDIPNVINAKDVEALKERLETFGSKYALTSTKSDPIHNFFIGLAYLGGIDVEVDHERAVNLISSSAESGCKEAAEKLVFMYENGEGVQRDYREAAEWRNKLVKILEEEYQANPTKEKAIRIIGVLIECGDAYASMYEGAYSDESIKKTAFDKYAEMQDKSERFQTIYSDTIFQRYIAISHNKLGDIYDFAFQGQKVKEHYTKAFELFTELSEISDSAETKRDLAISYEKVGYYTGRYYDTRKSEEYYLKSLEIKKTLEAKMKTVQARSDLAATYEELGVIAKILKAYDKAWEYYFRCLEIREKLAEETDSLKDRLYLADIYFEFGDFIREKYNPKDASVYFRKNLAICEKVWEETNTVRSLSDLASAYCMLGATTYNRKLLVKAKDIFDDLIAQYPDSSLYGNQRAVAVHYIQECEREDGPTNQIMLYPRARTVRNRLNR